jgi:hypothetical protein
MLAANAAFSKANTANTTADWASINASAAFAQANLGGPGGDIGPAFDKANSANIIAESAYAAGNTTWTYAANTVMLAANSAYGAQNTTYTFAANTVRLIANSAYSAGNTTYTYAANTVMLAANAAFSKANTANTTADWASLNASAAFAQANLGGPGGDIGPAFDKANSAYTFAANDAMLVANTAYGLANSTYTYAANTVMSAANSAYAAQNTTYTYAANTVMSAANSAFLAQNTTYTFAANNVRLIANTAFTRANSISINYVIDGSGEVITPGQKGYLEIPFACTVDQWTILLDQTGSIAIEVWADTYANFPPTNADSINVAPYTVNSGIKNTGSTDAATSIFVAGEILAYNVVSATTTTRATIALRAVKT